MVQTEYELYNYSKAKREMRSVVGKESNSELVGLPKVTKAYQD